MFVELNSLINVSEKDPPKRKFILLSDSQNDGSFIIHHFLALYIKDDLFKNLFIIIAQQCKKSTSETQLAIDKNGKVTNKQISLVHGQNGTLVRASLHRAISELPQPCFKARLCAKPVIFFSNASFTLQPLYNRIKSTFENEKEPCLLVIDDLSCLLSIGIHVQNVIDFAHYCYSLMCCSTTMLNGCFVTLVHNDSDVEDEESLLLWKQLCHYSHMELHVRGLSSGYCKDVHGQLTITQRDQHRTKHHTRNLQFKILEKNVTFFAPGMSKAVL
ncbi:unnamed protein product [Porites evermanni]|uniref:Elongator complex protein 6 n=1 Tax=Porites evermanni TaxID=104178 RepID=A0ABN8PH31_9CNID|nr:unnamed protein product [Porites evermanni]